MPVPRTVRTKFTVEPPKEIGERRFRFVASTEAKDRDGDIIVADGWRLDAFKRNPVILANHEYRRLPVARAARIGVENRRLMVEIEFPPKGTTTAADEAYALVKAGFLRAVSVGFKVLDHEDLAGGGWRITRAELLEVSLVSVPSNAEALAAGLARRGRRGVLYEVSVREAEESGARIGAGLARAIWAAAIVTTKVNWLAAQARHASR